MKVSLNHYTSNLLVEAKASSDDLTFNQLLIEAMEYLHKKYVTKEIPGTWCYTCEGKDKEEE